MVNITLNQNSVSKGTIQSDRTVPDRKSCCHLHNCLVYRSKLGCCWAVAKLWTFEWNKARSFLSVFFDGPIPLRGGLWGEASGCLPSLWILSDMHVWVCRVDPQQKGEPLISFFVIFYICSFAAFSELQWAALQLIKTMPEVSQWLYIVYRLTPRLLNMHLFFFIRRDSQCQWLKSDYIKT